MLDSIIGGVELGLLWSILAIGIYITYRILDFSDLTSEGSFTLGAATLASLIVHGVHPVHAVIASFIAGCLAGLITSILHVGFKIPTLLSGILTMTGVYSINLRIMGKANISLNNEYTLFAMVKELFGFTRNKDSAMIIAFIFLFIVIVGLILLFNTEIGYSIRATGNNEHMIRAAGVNTNLIKILGLMLANGLIALSGALVSQYNGYASVDLGIGAIVVGLASVIIGEVFFGRRRIWLSLIGVVFGSIAYRIIIAIVLRAGFNANDMQLFTALLVTFALSLPRIKELISLLIKKISFLSKQKEAIKEDTQSSMLKITGLNKTFNKGTINQKQALKEIHAELNAGDFVTVIGGNGAGKSTLLNLISGVYPRDSGYIMIDGIDVSRKTEHKRAKFIGRVFQDPMMGTCANMSIEENLAMALRRGKWRNFRRGITAQEKAMFKELLAPLDLGLEDRLTSKVGLLSGGQRQALTLLMATMLIEIQENLSVQKNLAFAYFRGKSSWFTRLLMNKKINSTVQKYAPDFPIERLEKTKAKNLTKDEHQQLVAIMAKLSKPKLLLLDEHTAALDPKTAKKVLDLTNKIIEEHQLTTIMITHNMKDALKYGNRLWMMNNGQLVIDLTQKEKQELNVNDLLKLFETSVGESMDNDRLLLS